MRTKCKVSRAVLNAVANRLLDGLEGSRNLKDCVNEALQGLQGKRTVNYSQREGHYFPTLEQVK